jgi:hypothetical protein
MVIVPSLTDLAVAAATASLVIVPSLSDLTVAAAVCLSSHCSLTTRPNCGYCSLVIIPSLPDLTVAVALWSLFLHYHI